jgi:hypothetical protein
MSTDIRMRQTRKRGLGRRTLALTTQILDIIAGFDGPMSVRQCFYQAVSRGAIDNSVSGYDKVQRLLCVLREDGQVPFTRIVDRGRRKHQRSEWDSVEEILHAVSDQYRRDAWSEQDTIVMVGCEKLALEGVFAAACDEYGASLWTFVGSGSITFFFDWATEIKRYVEQGKRVEIVYFGDHDPSGLVIEATARRKLEEHGAVFGWRRGGLLWEDFADFDVANVPVKKTDPNTKKYLTTYGNRAAELDALPPDVLRERVRSVITEHIDVERWNLIRFEEQIQQASLRLVAGNWDAALAGARGAA